MALLRKCLAELRSKYGDADEMLMEFSLEGFGHPAYDEHSQDGHSETECPLMGFASGNGHTLSH